MMRMTRRKHVGAGALAGLTGALTMTLVMALLRLGLGIPSPAELAGERLVPTLPVDQFIALIVRFGGFNQLKQFGVGSILAGQLVFGMLVGLLYAVVVGQDRAPAPARTGRWRFSRQGAFIGTVIGVIWLVSLGLLWPVLGANFKGLPPRPAAVATALGMLLAYTSYGLVLFLTFRILTGSQPRHQPAGAGHGVGRRAFLVGGVAVLLALAAGALVRRLFEQAVFSYDGLRYQGRDVQAITPNDKFYVVTKNIIDPRAEQALWRLDIAGQVDQPRTYAFADLAALPATTQETTLMCISNAVGDGLMSNALWKGVPLRTLLDAAGPKPGVVEVVLRAVDGYTDTIPFEKAMNPTTFVAYEMNGAPLPARHGYPVRVLVPGEYGEKSVKWVTRIELVDHQVKGFYEKQGWGPDFVIPTRSRFDFPSNGQSFSLASAQPLVLKGVAFGGDRGVARAEISVDGGQTWQEGRLDYPGSQLSWALWSYDWRPASPRNYQLAVRAIDRAGEVQTADVRDIVPDGATGYHRITVRIEP